MRRVVGGLLLAASFLAGGLWWLTGFVAYFNNFDGLAKFLGLFFIPVLALPLVGRGTVADVAVRGFYWWGWAVGAVFLQILGSWLWGDKERTRRKLKQSKPVLVHHVSLRSSDGAGATFELRVSGDERNWTWRLDPELVATASFWNMGPVQGAITKMEKELGVPLTWPPPPEDTRTKEEKEADRQANVERLRKEGEEGDVHSKIGYWDWVGEPVTDPSQLVEGYVYLLGSLGIYRGKFYGPKWKGMPDMKEYAEPAELEDRWWYAFEGSEVLVGEQPRSGIRLAPDDFEPKPLREGGEPYVHVRSIPVPQSEAVEAFEWQRADHLRWDRDRKEYWRQHPGEGPPALRVSIHGESGPTRESPPR